MKALGIPIIEAMRAGVSGTILIRPCFGRVKCWQQESFVKTEIWDEIAEKMILFEQRKYATGAFNHKKEYSRAEDFSSKKIYWKLSPDYSGSAKTSHAAK